MGLVSWVVSIVVGNRLIRKRQAHQEASFSETKRQVQVLKEERDERMIQEYGDLGEATR